MNVKLPFSAAVGSGVCVSGLPGMIVATSRLVGRCVEHARRKQLYRSYQVMFSARYGVLHTPVCSSAGLSTTVHNHFKRRRHAVKQKGAPSDGGPH